MMKGEDLKRIGMDTAAGKNLATMDWLDQARRVAMEIVKFQGCVSIVDVYRVLPRPDDVSPNVAGSVFKGLGLTPVHYIKNPKKSAHMRLVTLWGYDV